MHSTRSPLQEDHHEDNQAPRSPMFTNLHRRGSLQDSLTIVNPQTGEDSDEEDVERLVDGDLDSTSSLFGTSRVMYERNSEDHNNIKNVKDTLRNDVEDEENLNAQPHSMSKLLADLTYMSDEENDTDTTCCKKENNMQKLNIERMMIDLEKDEKQMTSMIIEEKYMEHLKEEDEYDVHHRFDKLISYLIKGLGENTKDSESDYLEKKSKIIYGDLVKLGVFFFKSEHEHVLRKYYILGLWNMIVCSTLLGLEPIDASPAIVPLVVYFLMMGLGYYFSSRFSGNKSTQEKKSASEKSISKGKKEISRPFIHSHLRDNSLFKMNHMTLLYIQAHKRHIMSKCKDKIKTLTNAQLHLVLMIYFLCFITIVFNIVANALWLDPSISDHILQVFPEANRRTKLIVSCINLCGIVPGIYFSMFIGQFGAFLGMFMNTLELHRTQIIVFSEKLKCHRIRDDCETAPLRRMYMEEYIFIKNMMISSSKRWQGMITTVLFLCTLLFIGFLTAGVVYNEKGVWMFWCVVTGAIFGGILNSAARANSAMDYLNETLTHAAPEDYKLIGGRDQWIEWTKTLRLAFTLYGVEITQSQLIGSVTTVITTLFGAILSVLL